MSQATEDYQRIRRAIAFLESQFQQQPSLRELAEYVGMSEFHLQRVFKRWAGISPKRFLQFVTVQYAKQRLWESRTVLETAYDAGLSGPGRLHDLMVTLEAVSPGEFKTQGNQLQIRYGVHPTPFGDCFVATTARGVCNLEFVETDSDAALDQLKTRWPQAAFAADPAATEKIVARIFLPAADAEAHLPLVVEGTNFQIRVWQALLRIPSGCVVSYQAVADHLQQPRAARAVGRAVAENHLAYLIPCHRVIRKMGLVTDYRWGPDRKRAMLAWEAAQHESLGTSRS